MKSILIVDDEENIRFLYKEEFESEGCRVSLAETAEEALELLEKERFDVVCLDIKLPGMDGIHFLEVLKDRWPDIPVVISSAYGHYKQDFRVWGAHGYVVKSADLTELKDKVKESIDACALAGDR